MPPRRWMLSLAGALAPLLLAVVWLEVQRSRAEFGAADPAAGDQPQVVFRQHLERLRNKRGQVTWQFEAELVQVLTSGDYLVYGLTHGQYFNHGNVEAHLRADTARFEARTGNVTAEGNVRLLSPRGLRVVTERLYWLEAEGKMVVPEVASMEWHDPARPEAPPALVSTTRVFLWPLATRLEFPDSLTVKRGSDQLVAAAASGDLEAGSLTLAAPLELAAMAPGDTVTGADTGLLKRLVLSVPEGGRAVYQQTTGAARISGGLTVDVPADSLRLTCDQADYVAAPERQLVGSGNLVVTDPSNRLTAPTATVLVDQRRADFSAPVRLVHQATGDGGQMTVTCGRLSYFFAHDVRRVEATERVRLVFTPSRRPPPGVTLFDAARSQPVTMTCSKLVSILLPGRRWSEATGSPRFEQPGRTATSRRASYDHEQELLYLDGRVELRNRAGERARCQQLMYDLRLDEVTIQTPAAAQFFLED